MVKIQHTWHTHITMGARRGGGGGENRRSPPPPMEKQTFFLLYGGLLATCSLCEALLLRFSTYVEPFSPCEVLSAPFFSMWGPLCYVFLLMGPFSPCEGLSAPLFSMWGAFFALMWGLLWAGVHAHYIYYDTAMLKCINIQIYKITVIISTHNYICTYCYVLCVKNVTPPGPYFTK